jgi:hypothetical protein
MDSGVTCPPTAIEFEQPFLSSQITLETAARIFHLDHLFWVSSAAKKSRPPFEKRGGEGEFEKAISKG